jgi:simple sugar transport system ATP-binding protein
VSRTSASRVRDLCESLSLSADLDAPAETLSAPERQRLAIVRALYRGVQCLILDEPTSLLGPSERASLFDTMRRLAASGAAVIFISHKLSEVFDVSDSITVLRCGRAVLECETQRASPTQVAVAMVGESFSAEPALASAPSETLVKLSDVSTSGEGRDSLKSVSLDLRRGEVVGIAGVAGNGQRALADVVLGIARPVAGSVSYPRGKPDAGFVGDDISAMDLVPLMRVWENRIFGREGDHARWWGIPVAAVKRDTERLAKEFGVRGDVDAPVSSLSGGNRQRLALARELDAAPSLLVVEEPSRGLDVRGADLIRRRIRQAAAGAAVLLISYDLDELYALSDRILVISSGRLLEPSTQPPMRSELAVLMTG